VTTPTDLRQLQDLFEGCWDRDQALTSLELDRDPDAIRAWTRWETEIAETGVYRFADPGSPQGLLDAVFTAISDLVPDDEAWAECCAICDEASPYREVRP
jgi:hypothetical protein